MANQIKIDNSVLKRRKYQKPKRKPKIILCKILIVCEGEKTEPNYFKAFNGIQRGSVVYDITTDGGGINTIGVVDYAIKLRDAAIKQGKPFDSVWAVFDKDSFSSKNFNSAINKADGNDINCAWSNEAFELWYLLHFHNRVTPMDRTQFKKAISDAVNNLLKAKKKSYIYAKNDTENYAIINKYGNQTNAIRWAKVLYDNFHDHKFHNHNPCTTVYQLVLQLEGQDEELNKRLETKIEAE